jgi:hypothetical protein
VLVGGEIIFNGRDARFDGIVVSGLNAQLTGPGPRKGDLGRYKVDFDYDSRYVRRAMQAFAGFAPIANAWIDNWASY